MNKTSLEEKIRKLKQSAKSKEIKQRAKEFEQFEKTNKKKLFSELSFCLLTANYQAEKSWQIQKKLEREFHISSQKELAKKLKECGHRFWPQRAERIVLARAKLNELKKQLNKPSKEIRTWLVKNVKGLGMKESSHFLRNIGYIDVAIIDFHIVDLLVKEKLIERPKTITPKKYLEIELILDKLARKMKLNLAELDLYLWYLETGKVLK